MTMASETFRLLRCAAPGKIRASLLLACSSLFAWLPAEETGHLPVSPKLLLEALPRTVENWTLRESRGGSDLGAVWLESFALRRFEPSPPSEAPDAPGKARVTLSVLDTAAHPGSEAESFSDFAHGKAVGENWLFVRVDGRPALVPRSRDKIPDEMRVFVADRFLVTLRLEGGSAGTLRFWLKQVDFERLEKIPQGPLVPLPAGFSAVLYDELSGKGISDQGITLGKSLTGEDPVDSSPDSGDSAAE